MFCSNCGVMLKSDAKFCPSCGAPISAPGHPGQAAGAGSSGQGTTPVYFEQAAGAGSSGQGTAPVYSGQAAGAGSSGQGTAPVYSGQAADAAWRGNLSGAENAALQGQRVTENIYLGADGTYRWLFELDLVRNPTQFITVVEAFGIVWIVMAVMFLVMGIINDNLESYLPLAGYWALITVILIAISWPIYLLVSGGRYWVFFEMNEKGVTHYMASKSFKKAQAAGFISALLSSDAISAASNLARSSVNSWHSDFSTTKAVKVNRRRQLIAVNGILMHNQVFARDEDFDFVLNYILARVPAAVAQQCRGR